MMLTRSYYKKRQEEYNMEENKKFFVAWMARGNETGVYMPTDVQEVISSFLSHDRLEQKNISEDEFRTQIYKILTKALNKKQQHSEQLFILLAENLKFSHAPRWEKFLKIGEKKLIEFGGIESWGHEKSRYFWDLIYENDYPVLN